MEMEIGWTRGLEELEPFGRQRADRLVATRHRFREDDIGFAGAGLSKHRLDKQPANSE